MNYCRTDDIIAESLLKVDTYNAYLINIFRTILSKRNSISIYISQ